MTAQSPTRPAPNPRRLPQSLIGRWVMAVRPWSLSLALAPVAVGTVLAWAATGRFNGLVLVAAALGAVLIQVGTNLYNDAADFERGNDGPGRLGPPRATALGLLPGRAVKLAAVLSFALAAVCGLYLAAIGGWPIVLLGLASIAAGLAYTAGPLPIAYTPLGEVFVVVFFGLGAVGGTYWLQTGALGQAPLIAGLAVGLFAAAVLLVNNHRDVVADARVGRRTLAILIGSGPSKALYTALVIAPILLTPLFVAPTDRRPVAWLVFLAALPAVLLARRFSREPPGPGLNLVLKRTAQLQILYAALVCVALAAQRALTA